MKKLFLTILLSSFCSLAFGAIPTDSIWEVRTTGDDTNGGCYDRGGSGTDYSQQDAAQLALTDLACASNTTLTSATGGFTSTMVDNCIYIASGTNFVAGYYEITGYTNTNTVTIDRTAASGGDATSGSGKVGGAIASPGLAAAQAVGGQTVYIKAGTYKKYGANDYVLAPTYDNNFGNVVLYMGYKTTRDDDPTGSDRPVFDGDAGGASEVSGVLQTGGYNGMVFKNFIFQNGATNNITGGGNPSFVNCKITGAGADNFSPGTIGLYFSEVSNAASEAFEGSQTVYAYASYIHDNADLQSTSTGGTKIFSMCVVDTNSGGMETGMPFIVNNVFYNSGPIYGQGNNGYGTPNGIIANNVFLDESTSISQDGADIYYGTIINNEIYNVTNQYGSNIKTHFRFNTITTDPLFNAKATGDFTLTTGSGAIDTGMGIGNTGITGSYKLNIGVDQDDTVTAGGGGAHSYGFSN